MKWILLCWMLAGLAARAAEPWADASLTVTNGLELWLDGSRQIALRQKQGPRWLSEGARVDRWFDGSGHRRDLSQLSRDFMPQFRTGSGVAWMRFDGRDDFMAARAPGLQFKQLSLFLVAAPRSNDGFFRGLLSFSELSRNDYVRGLNLDLGPASGTLFDWLNVESAGAGGAANLQGSASPFGQARIITLASSEGREGVKTWVDGKLAKSRDRAASVIHASEIFAGSRFYSNIDDVPHAQGFFDGDIAEILAYDRVLDDAERARVHEYLAGKYHAWQAESARGDAFNPLVPVSNPPVAQVFVPGFAARELPVQLPNINCVKYRADGKLYALGYNGQIHLLSDTNGDGLEEMAEPFWTGDSLRSPIGMAVTPPGYARGQGVFVAAKKKVVLIVDTNGDNRADEEIIVSQGWPELIHNVDALGVAVGPDGSVYFGLGATDFTNAYLVDRGTGKARYDLRSERGTILKVSPDFQRREIVCTGIRFPVALAFNAAGDLFCTDQEGATWLPNGNPLDELLHIQTGRHYGFPPRHPKYLPGVIDEPSVFDYAPQHQSTCGLNFNEPVNGGGPIFGPEEWRGDAFVAGYSRGKIYRTKLVKTPAGYVAQNHLLASINMLPADVCVSPRGELVIAAHSGQPDWGSGPGGLGKLVQIRREQPELPQPVAVWAASPTETWVAWDRPLTPEQARVLAKDAATAGGKFVGAGDRFEALRPGYQVVQDQLGAERFLVPTLGAQVSPDRQTLILRTEPRAQAVSYAVVLGSTARTNAAAQSAVRQHPAIDLAYTLNGVEAEWRSANAATNWTGWLPGFDTQVSRALLRSSAPHQALSELAKTKGSLKLRAQINLWQMLRPAVQPGSRIDYEWPQEKVFVRFAAHDPFTLAANECALSSTAKDSIHEIVVESSPEEGRWLKVEAVLPTGAGDSPFNVTWHTAEDGRERALSLGRIYLPWAAQGAKPEAKPAAPPELAGADWLNGRRIFFSAAAACSQCHLMRGEGRKVGPDLSNLIHRDYASVRKDIAEPNAALNPDHLTYIARTKDGEAVSGVLQQDTADAVVLAMAGAEPMRIPRGQIESLTPSALSLMPEGIAAALGEKAFRDLMAFLLIAPLEPASLETGAAPVTRSRQEVNELWKTVEPPSASPQPFRVLLVDGPKDHGPDEHDYPLWKQRWARLLALDSTVIVTTASRWPSPEQLAAADVAVFYSNNPEWSKDRAAELEAFQKHGGGLVYLHYAVDGQKDVEALSDRIGLAWRGGASKFRHGALDLAFEARHPITKGFSKIHFHDESYWKLIGNPASIRLLASGMEDGAAQPLMWARENGEGRVFVSILGHYTWTFDDPAFRLLVLRGIAWAARQPEDRLAELALVGARIRDE